MLRFVHRIFEHPYTSELIDGDRRQLAVVAL
jgi:hypothetical protein